ncbi:MAG TPA: zinc ribbon domain-containing protein [Opitutus sp.]|nr:zinc ribbon domain-containing protein [Opitutus sp.]
MATYVYETIPLLPGVEPRRFEVQQSMKEAALTRDPATGEPVRRVIVGGFGYAAQKSAASPSAPPASCGPRCACCR